MKKGIVMEQHRRFTIIMTREGTFQKAIPIKDAAIGAEVSYNGWTSAVLRSVPTRLLVTVCLLILLLAPFYFLLGENETYAYVNVDINPSIELAIDEGLDVYSARPVNKDATGLVNDLTGYQGTQLEKVIAMIMEKCEETERINEEKNMLIGFSYTNNEPNNNPISDNLERLRAEGSDWEVVIFRVPKDVREAAKEENKSMNEMMAKTIRESSVKNIDAMNEDEKAIIHTFYHTDSQDDDVEYNNKEAHTN
ncbi:anti-sigma-I factor RsgI family protein [Virgibacillus natechei]|uniref:anti-sigma-I factor RsgI family protein n=1 Tax=Virgibacillus sp. CBA3643 TaxID=2942278 RepID=UPI0035A35D7D